MAGRDVFLSVELDGDSEHSFTLVTHAAIMKGEREDARIEKDAAFSVIGFLSSGADGDSINLASDEGERDAADAQLSVLSELLPSPGNLSFTFPGEVPLLGGNKVYDANQFILGCHYTTAASDGNDIWATKSRYYYANEEVPGPSLEPEQPVEIAPSGDRLSRVAATAAALAGLSAAGIGIASAFASDPEKRQSASR